MENNNDTNSCLMLAVNLNTPVDLGCIFDSEDLKDTGIELDSHITLLYAQGKKIEKDNLLDNIKNILGEANYSVLEDFCKKENTFDALDIFELDCFENDSDYIILKLKKNFKLFTQLELLNKGLKSMYDVSSEFSQYTPHITLAELEPGKAKKYLESEKLKLVLEDSYVDFEDLLVSYGKSNEVDREQYFLTQFKCVDRFFRLINLKENNKELV